MSRGELLNILTKYAREFRQDREHFARNRHMHEIAEAPTQETVDAVLIGFINHVAGRQGVDWGMYAKDLAPKHEH